MIGLDRNGASLFILLEKCLLTTLLLFELTHKAMGFILAFS